MSFLFSFGLVTTKQEERLSWRKQRWKSDEIRMKSVGLVGFKGLFPVVLGILGW